MPHTIVHECARDSPERIRGISVFYNTTPAPLFFPSHSFLHALAHPLYSRFPESIHTAFSQYILEIYSLTLEAPMEMKMFEFFAEGLSVY